ncbi:MerR family transcriptional regulator [Bradyrhizobium symbiodeficiens]|uniref:MerR family transcriptional regulator n=1 Tax=Bradyrhizobium symbiodeficiens TaxID=1404367 RepID=A0A2U8QDR9_9BRAD|nr:MerR family transcriptional regulator [Bradyrhizobium symbiodeficiens]AWM07919.1 MerR family transcriptional regulator [Bradyrhizobium symbiodeficiens]QDF38417.1 MerR family transcriptional regulator [Bradyrhizobium symbiodeficiens]QIP00905.1 MerR family transcriptional regulator [Bradyrhizobium symbiodeficiens]QIP09472.1 MerR family transcriptional regulator [Bradyrhizobium symbiodeficiens]
MDKAPDAFRTISEVAQELDIPQHVLRFWETRFSQIKPMKRSGGRRYYRPDDVDLLKGIRRLLYGEGYTIRGVQRILKEHGVKSVQGLADSAAAVSFGAIEDAIGASLMEPEDEEAPIIKGVTDADEDDYQGDEEEGIDFRFSEVDDEDILTTFRKGGTTAAAPAGPSALDRERLGRVLADLVACREMLDQALKDG